MKNALIIFAILMLLDSFIVSCVGDRPCMSYAPNAHFEFKNSQTGQNLLFGSGKIYDASLIKVYGLQGADTTFIPVFSGRNPSSDSVFIIDFSAQKFDTAYIKLTATDVDTLAMLYELHKGYGDCTDTYTIDSISYNGANVPISNKQTFVIQK